MTTHRPCKPGALVIAAVLIAGGCGAGDGAARPAEQRSIPGAAERAPAQAAAPAGTADSPPAGPQREDTADLPAPSPRAANPRGPLRVAMYRASAGIAQESFDATERLMGETPGVVFSTVTPESVGSGALDSEDVVIFTGGRGSIQGRLLGDGGRARVRAFVRRGGGYVGVCAGAYLALQGRAEFYKLAIVAGQHTGDAWQRGVATVDVREHDSRELHRLFYANGPVVHPVSVDGLSPYVALADYASDVFSPAHGTEPGQMPGSPAVLAARYGQGRILLFSPNPVLAAPTEQPRPEMMQAAVRWVGTPGPVDPELTFDDVFSTGG